jgi:enoyl-CoA hydratase/carnithine racemase
MSQLLTHIDSGIGWITINRPEALNALNSKMFNGIADALHEWGNDSTLRYVVIQSAGGKAFCAGGDVRSAAIAISEGKDSIVADFFRHEYKLNSTIYNYPKPYIALIDGIAMGGGLGVSILGSHRIVTENAKLAMPESTIGFFPDVGASTFLNYAPGSVGLYLALTGFIMNAADSLWTGLATHFIPSSQLTQFKNEIQEDRSLDQILENYKKSPEEKGFLEHHFDQINHHFDKSSLQEIFESLKNDPSPFAQNTYNTLLSKSPTSLSVIFHLFRYVVPPLSFEERLKVDFRLTLAFHKGHDFIEGVRALLIDKDKLPRWKPSKLEDIKESDVEAYFKPIGERELVL